ncbi:MAG: glutamate racemase [Selenomonadaceae bacterium]
MDSCAPIGIFDSGIGGLTVVKELRQMLPNEDLIYMGDTARVPYGSRDPQEIVQFMHQNMHFFMAQKVKMVVIACNTTTTNGYAIAKEMYSVPIIPMNSAICEAIEAGGGNKRIGVIATEATVHNEMHRRSAEEIDAAVEIYAKACPDFVPLIEGGQIAGPEIEAAAQKYMGFFKGIGIGSLILGCTHYPLIADILRKHLSTGIHLVNPARATVLDAVTQLKKEQLLHQGKNKGGLKMCFSADIEKARKMVKLVLNVNTAEFKCVDLTKYEASK